MSKRSLQDSRFAALFILGCLALLYPLISLFNRDATVFGIPVLYAYIYGTWAALIILAAITARRRRGDDEGC